MNLVNKFCLYTFTISTIVTGGFITPSSQAQKVVNINPALNSEEVSPDTSISGVFEGKAINVKSVKIYLDQKDITSESTITRNFFSYKPSRSLSPGIHVVRVEYKNVDAVKKEVSWSFKVENPVADLKIFSITHNAAEPLGKKSTFLATIKGTPGASADILLFPDDQDMITIPAEEISDGVYVATYNVNIQNSSNEGIVVGRLVNKERTIYDAATQGFIFNNEEKSTEAPAVDERELTLEPNFLNYKNGDRIDTRGFILEGETKPNATVEITVSYSQKVFGGFINLDQTFFDQKVTADKDGYFDISIPAPNGVSSDAEYTVTATASDGKDRSEPVKLTLIQN